MTADCCIMRNMYIMSKSNNASGLDQSLCLEIKFIILKNIESVY